MPFDIRFALQGSTGRPASGNHRLQSAIRATIESLEVRRLFAVLTVNGTGDDVTSDSILTLREAIGVINDPTKISSLGLAMAQVDTTTEGLGINDTIHFNIPGGGDQTISPTSNLPAILNPVTIDGYSQPDSEPATATSAATLHVRLDGGLNASNGLNLVGGNSTERGLVFDNFSGSYALNVQGNNNVVAGNYFGLTPDGRFSEGNEVGVELNSASETVIGGVTPADRNVISENFLGIDLQISVSDCTVEGNYIGTDPSGENEMGNDGEGIELESAQNIIIGGASSGARNVISGNGAFGIAFGGGDGTPQGCRVVGNYIGTDAEGTVALGGNEGIEINGDGTTTSITIGGTAAGDANVISGNDGDGIFITGAAGNIVEGNRIGTNAAGTGVLGNGANGIEIYQDHNDQIGGTDAGAGNVISGNTENGIRIDTDTSTTVQGNRIGVLADGVTAAGNGGSGVFLLDGSTNFTMPVP